MAEALNIPENHPILEDILNDLPHDDDWDISNPIHAVYKKKGLKRYKLEGVLGFTEKAVINKTQETLVSSANASSSCAVLQDIGSSASGSGAEGSSLSVKVENPTFITMQQQLNVVKSGKLQLEKLYSQALDLKVIIQGKASSDPAFAKKCEDYSKSCVSLDKFLQEAREFIYNLESLTASSDCSMELQHTNMMVDKCMAHTDGIKSLLKRTRAML